MPQPPWHLTPNAPLDMDGQKITNLAAGVAADDAATVAQAGGTPFNGGTITNPLDIELAADAVALIVHAASGGGAHLADFIPDNPAQAIGIDSFGRFIAASFNFLLTGVGVGESFAVSLPATTVFEIDDDDTGDSIIKITAGTPDQLQLRAGGSLGARGQALVSDASSQVAWNTLGSIKNDTHAAQASGIIAAGEVYCWFDQSNGAGAFNLKGKTADGTVVTATIPMAHVQVLGWITEPPDGAAVRYDQANRALASAQQTALADLNLGTLTLLTDAITAIGTMQTKINSLLAKLRTAGVLAT